MILVQDFLLYLQCEINEREVMLDFDSDLDLGTSVDGVVYLHRHKDTVMKFLKANYKVLPGTDFEKSFELLPPDPKEPERILVNVLADWIEARHTIRAIANKRFRFNKVKRCFLLSAIILSNVLDSQNMLIEYHLLIMTQYRQLLMLLIILKNTN